MPCRYPLWQLHMKFLLGHLSCRWRLTLNGAGSFGIASAAKISYFGTLVAYSSTYRCPIRYEHLVQVPICTGTKSRYGYQHASVWASVPFADYVIIDFCMIIIKIKIRICRTILGKIGMKILDLMMLYGSQI